MAKIAGVHNRTKVQVKTMTVGSTTTEYLSQLKFSNLVVGKKYRITYNLSVRSNGVVDSGISCISYNADNTASNPILSMQSQPQGGANDDTISASKIFTAVTAFLSLRHIDSGSAEIRTDSVANYAVLEELSIETQDTTDFT